MVGTYAIGRGETSCGSVTVEKRGLYYHFSCRCHLTGEVMHRLLAVTDSGTVDLGVCVPMDGMFGVDKTVPCKTVGDGIPEFQLVPKHERMGGRFVPVYPDEPYGYLSRLKDSYLSIRNGQAGIVITE